MRKVICSSETLLLTRATWHHIPEEGALHVSEYFISLYAVFFFFSDFISVNEFEVIFPVTSTP
jgi:hypothetical protein